MTIEDRIKVVEVMALALDPPAVFDVETPLREDRPAPTASSADVWTPVVSVCSSIRGTVF